MSDPLSDIKMIRPAYPVKPTQPLNKDRKSGKRHSNRPTPDKKDPENDDEQSKIDEYV